ncbi:hypothetical protein V6N13_068457 [Hibiscus sabdariffa]|uniref:Uncharacterized protein n=1 Tax=Hibiscus sabdariffa TaxID=183260 RepID=A0ABR2QMN7_9ROSI
MFSKNGKGTPYCCVHSCKPKMRNMNMLVFPGVDMLQKLLQMTGEASYKSGEDCSVMFDLNVSAESLATETDAAAVESTMPLPDDSLKNSSSSCIPAPEERKLEFDSQSICWEQETVESIVKQNLDSKYEGCVKHTENMPNIIHSKIWYFSSSGKFLVFLS